MLAHAPVAVGNGKPGGVMRWLPLLLLALSAASTRGLICTPDAVANELVQTIHVLGQSMEISVDAGVLDCDQVAAAEIPAEDAATRRAYRLLMCHTDHDQPSSGGTPPAAQGYCNDWDLDNPIAPESKGVCVQPFDTNSQRPGCLGSRVGVTRLGCALYTIATRAACEQGSGRQWVPRAQTEYECLSHGKGTSTSAPLYTWTPHDDNGMIVEEPVSWQVPDDKSWQYLGLLVDGVTPGTRELSTCSHRIVTATALVVECWCGLPPPGEAGAVVVPVHLGHFLPGLNKTVGWAAAQLSMFEQTLAAKHPGVHVSVQAVVDLGAFLDTNQHDDLRKARTAQWLYRAGDTQPLPLVEESIKATSITELHSALVQQETTRLQEKSKAIAHPHHRKKYQREIGSLAKARAGEILSDNNDALREWLNGRASLYTEFEVVTNNDGVIVGALAGAGVNVEFNQEAGGEGTASEYELCLSVDLAIDTDTHTWTVADFAAYDPETRRYAPLGTQVVLDNNGRMCSKVAQVGWLFPIYRVAGWKKADWPQCDPVCDSARGRCARGQCQCKDGWTGPDCSQCARIDACGVCNGDGSSCKTAAGETCCLGWKGEDCSIKDKCYDVTCTNGGMCIPRTGLCTCPLGFDGPYCNVRTCNLKGKYDAVADACVCMAGWAGQNCRKCQDSPSKNTTNLCIPAFNGELTYLLRGVSNAVVMPWLEGKHPLSQAAGRPAIRPNTAGHDNVIRDCACELDQGSEDARRTEISQRRSSTTTDRRSGRTISVNTVRVSTPAFYLDTIEAFGDMSTSHERQARTDAYLNGVERMMQNQTEELEEAQECCDDRVAAGYRTAFWAALIVAILAAGIAIIILCSCWSRVFISPQRRSSPMDAESRMQSRSGRHPQQPPAVVGHRPRLTAERRRNAKKGTRKQGS